MDTVRSKFGSTQKVLGKNIREVQRKIKKRLRLKSLMKYLETIKYLDKANLTIKNLMEKTDFKKISELLLVINNCESNQFSHIKILKHRFQEIQKLKSSFFDTLIKISKKKIQIHFEEVFTEFENYTINYCPEVELFETNFEGNKIAEINTILLELQYFDEEKDFFLVLTKHFTMFYNSFNKKIIEILSKHLIFKRPSTDIILSYQRLCSYVVNSYKCLYATSRT